VLEAIRDPEFESGTLLDRARPTRLAFLADIVCGAGDANLAGRMLDLLSPHRDRHVTSANGSVYYGPVRFSLGALALKAGRIQQAREHLDLAVTESGRAHSVVYVAGSEFYLAQVLGLEMGASLVERRAELLESARHAASQYQLGHLEECLDRLERAPRDVPVFRC
jgi:hypothetical protein